MATPPTSPLSSLTTFRQEHFKKEAERRLGSIGVLLELRRAVLFRVDHYDVDDWGAKIRLTHVPSPGFWPASKESPEISSMWDWLSVDDQRWQMTYGWKFLFGEAAIETAMAVGAEAAARGVLLTDSQVLSIFRWQQSLETRLINNQRPTDLPGLIEMLFDPPSVSSRLDTPSTDGTLDA